MPLSYLNNRLNYRHLHYFWAVAKEGNLTRVAEHLFVSQSALSSQIRLLEEQIGHALFIREGRTLKLTEVGYFVFSYADEIFGLGAELVATLKSGGGQKIQKLRVGSATNLSRNFQENFLRPVVAMPNVRLILESGGLDELLSRLALHKLDLILSNRPVGTDAGHEWRCRRIARQPVCLIGKPRKIKKPFRFPEDLAQVPLLLPSHNSDIRTEFDMLCDALQIPLTIFAEVDDMAMLRLLTRDSGGVALLPAVVVQDELASGVLEQYCKVPKLYENFYAISVERKFQSDILQTLLTKR